MVAYDSRRSPDSGHRLKTETLDALAAALVEQRGAGRHPVDALRSAVATAAQEARERSIPPEALLVQLKRLADDAGLAAMIGDEQTNAVREWLVNACITAYFQAE